MKIEIEKLQLIKIPASISSSEFESTFRGEGIIIDLRGPIYFGWYSLNNYGGSCSYWLFAKISNGNECSNGRCSEFERRDSLEGPFYWVPLYQFKNILIGEDLQQGPKNEPIIKLKKT